MLGTARSTSPSDAEAGAETPHQQTPDQDEVPTSKARRVQRRVGETRRQCEKRRWADSGWQSERPRYLDH